MPVDLLALGAAFMSGLFGSIHCMAMCGGIATGLGAASADGSARRFGPARALELNLGRIIGYALAGAVAGGLGGGLLRIVDHPALGLTLRIALGVAMMLLALRLVGAGDRWNFLSRAGVPVWRVLAPLQRRLMPARTATRRLALGLLWGWLPCGLSSSLLVVAWLQAEAWHGALVMTAFGLGTTPAMVPLTWTGARRSPMRAPGMRRATALFVFTAGLITASAPWMMKVSTLHPLLDALGCRPIG